MKEFLNITRKYAVDPSVFVGDLTPKAAYWIGFLLADGCITNKNLRLAVELAADDVTHLEKLRSFLKSNHPIVQANRESFGKLQSSCKLYVYSKELCQKLIELGITPRKSLTAEVPENLRTNNAFWRGVWDGDGWFTWHRTINNGKSYLYPEIGLSGTPAVVSKFRDYCNLRIVSKAKLRLSDENFAQFVITGKGAIKILKSLYQDSDIYLERKFISVEALLN